MFVTKATDLLLEGDDMATRTKKATKSKANPIANPVPAGWRTLPAAERTVGVNHDWLKGFSELPWVVTGPEGETKCREFEAVVASVSSLAKVKDVPDGCWPERSARLIVSGELLVRE